MNVMPTLEGGLRIETEGAADWHYLHGITSDAVSCHENLAHRLGKLITDEEAAADWNDYIVPDLEEGFSNDLLHVTTVIASAHLESAGGPGALWITPADALQWYSALNQARLAIEERCHFGPSENIRLAGFTAVERAAFLRSQFYGMVQRLLLEHVLR